jgi:molecular chaperone GrpE
LEGLEKIFVDNQPFDPLHSEAAGVEEVETEDEDNIVLRELQRGYTLKGSLLRPARVVVGRYSGPREPKAERGTEG